ncbi:ClpX C4-type zinc finger protein [Paracoccus kondratievae]|uniref:ClpX C4-type zinc finger protein n=1 Tax=Paracoccus kondratievae TaxID=135740 RepID=UPI0035A22298
MRDLAATGGAVNLPFLKRWRNWTLSTPTLTLRERVQGACRLLFGRGDNALICSFCGRSRISGETVVAGPGVAICGSCSFLALDSIEGQTASSEIKDLTQTGVMPLLEPMCLLPALRERLAEDLSAAAASVHCDLVGWSYHCSSSTGDYLSVRLSRPKELPGDLLHEQFRTAFLGL